MGEIVAAVGTCHTPYMFTRPPDENPQQLDQAGAAMQELGKVLDETKPDAILFFGSDHVETFSVTCVPSFAIIAGSRAVAKFAGREHNLPIHRGDGRGHPQQAGRRPQLRHGVFGRRRARPCVFDSVRARDRQARHSGDSVLHQRLRAAAADATTMRGAREGRSPRSCSGRKERVAVIASGGMSHFPGTTSISTRSSTSIAGWCRNSRPAMPTRCLNMTGTQLDEVGNTETAQLGGDVRRDRCPGKAS